MALRARAPRSGKFIFTVAGAVGIQLLTASCVQRAFNPAQKSESEAKQTVGAADTIFGLDLKQAHDPLIYHTLPG